MKSSEIQFLFWLIAEIKPSYGYDFDQSFWAIKNLRSYFNNDKFAKYFR